MFKWVPAESEADARFRRVAERYRLPTYYNVWPQVVFSGLQAEQIRERLDAVRAAGHRGFMLYESAAFIRARADGTFEITYPVIPEVVVPWARGR